MIKYLLLLSIPLLFSACVNKHGVSIKYYSDCKEYYDLQGYYHKDCGDDDIVTYKTVGELIKGKEPEPEGNVW
jgi:hypothetical protein